MFVVRDVGVPCRFNDLLQDVLGFEFLCVSNDKALLNEIADTSTGDNFYSILMHMPNKKL